MKLQTLKGFKDYLPAEALKRKFVVSKITEIYQKFGFEPLETPTLEYAETLLGKYGEEERLIYKFTTAGGDEVAMKYDQTVPLARVVAQYGPTGSQQLPIPFKRYQIQSAFRGENTQKGRYREFTQCDADVVGVSSPLVDAEIMAIAFEIYKNLGLEVVIKVNDRELLKDIEPKFLAAIDKLNKIGDQGVLEELEKKGLSPQETQKLLNQVKALTPSARLKETTDLFVQMGYPADSYIFDPTLVRGLDYYTGIIYEAVLKSNPTGPSVGGGGRYDKMINIPANGYSVGLDRTIEAMEESGVLQIPSSSAQVIVTIFSEELTPNSLNLALHLRDVGIFTELWLDPTSKLDKQLKYADQKGIPYAVIIGPEEAESNQVVLKDLKNRTQEKLSPEELILRLGP